MRIFDLDSFTFGWESSILVRRYIRWKGFVGKIDSSGSDLREGSDFRVGYYGLGFRTGFVEGVYWGE